MRDVRPVPPPPARDPADTIADMREATFLRARVTCRCALPAGTAAGFTRGACGK